MTKIFLITFILFSINLYAQDITQETLDWNIDDIFKDTDETEETIINQNQHNLVDPPLAPIVQETVIDQLKKRTFIFSADYRFDVGLSSGWHFLPWEEEFHRRDYYLERFFRLRTDLGMEAQISNEFRVVNTLSFSIPQAAPANFLRIEIGVLYFDYNIHDYVFVRGGKWGTAWGISPNYGFTNLLNRIPSPYYAGDSYIFRVDVPIGIGGIQFLTLTRVPLLYDPNIILKLHDFGFGSKFNLALPILDLDLGAFYQEGMPFRSFLSLKKTVFNFELYNEYLVAVNKDDNYYTTGALNFGFGREFFDSKLTLSSEVLYNAEQGTSYYQEETTFRDASAISFVEGLNMAFNILYKPFQKGNPRLFCRVLVNPEQDSAQIVPGARLSPANHVEFYLAVPMSVGSKDGYYRQYGNTFVNDPGAEDRMARPLPFAVVFMVTLSGGVRIRNDF